MEKDIIISKLKKICEDSGLEDLDLEFFPETIPNIDNGQIGEFFILNDILYLGENSGEPNYCAIGNCDALTNILYRLYLEDRMIDIIFEFPEYRISIEHDEYKSMKISIFDTRGGYWILKDLSLNETREIERCIKEITTPNYSESEKEEMNLLKELTYFRDIKGKEHEWDVLVRLIKPKLNKPVIKQEFCLTCLLNGTLDKQAELFMASMANINEIFKVIDELYEVKEVENYDSYKARLIECWLLYHETEFR